MMNRSISKILADTLVVYSYGFWILFLCAAIWGSGELFREIPLSLRLLFAVIFVLPAVVVPIGLWIYSLGRVDEFRKSGDFWYYLFVFGGFVTAFVFYFRHLRKEIGNSPDWRNNWSNKPEAGNGVEAPGQSERP